MSRKMCSANSRRAPRPPLLLQIYPTAFWAAAQASAGTPLRHPMLNGLFSNGTLKSLFLGRSLWRWPRPVWRKGKKSGILEGVLVLIRREAEQAQIWEIWIGKLSWESLFWGHWNQVHKQSRILRTAHVPGGWVWPKLWLGWNDCVNLCSLIIISLFHHMMVMLPSHNCSKILPV